MQFSGSALDKGTLWAKSHSAGSPILDGLAVCGCHAVQCVTCGWRSRFQQIAENGNHLQNPASCVKSPINRNGKHIFAGCLKCGPDHGLFVHDTACCWSLTASGWSPIVFKGFACRCLLPACKFGDFLNRRHLISGLCTGCRT